MGSNVTTYLKNYQPAAFNAETVDLNFDLYEDHVLVTNRMHLHRAHSGPLVLFGDELELVSIHQDDKQIPEDAYRIEGSDLIIPKCTDDAKLTIVTKIYPNKNTALSGLFRSKDVFCTQCEAEGFRRMTYFLDRPDVLATYTTRISADQTKYPMLLSNGNLIDKGATNDGRHWVLWQDPFKKPSYLFALVAGNLAVLKDEFITRSKKKVDLEIYVEPGNEDKCEHAMASLKRAMRWDEEEFGREYDLSIFMIVAVSDFNMGAMENKGLNIFNSKYILAKKETATDQDFADIEGVVGHEYFHNWTGNRVTCRDWFQLSLKEGLTVFRDQEFSRDMGSRDVNRILDVKALRSTQFPEDAGSMAHPVRPASYEEINNFYTATIYNKGAEVIRMQQTLLGTENFRRGMDLYFERHDGNAVTIDDFVAAMEDASGRELTQFKRWYSQAGTPIVTMISEHHGDLLNLTFTQSCPKTPECSDKKPFHIPLRIALYDKHGKALPLENEVLELKEPQQVFRFEGINEKPVVSILRDFSAPVILHREFSQEELLALMRFETNGFAKWDAALVLALRCITDCYLQSSAQWQLPKALLDAYEHVLLDESLDLALRAELLTLPNFEDVAVNLKDIDVTRVEDIREALLIGLGRALYPVIEATYKRLWKEEDNAMNEKAYARRKLRNVCLRLMMKANESAARPFCEEQYKKAGNMTDQIASFAYLVNCAQEKSRKGAIDSFYQQWSHEELVLDKWFAIQAGCELPETLDEVKALLSHKDFSIKNPNKVRALIGTFVQGNPRHFHAIDGSGYAFLTEMILKLDPLNPQVAARIATPFSRWQRLDTTRQTLIKQQLERLAAAELSPDMKELVLKSMKD